MIVFDQLCLVLHVGQRFFSLCFQEQYGTHMQFLNILNWAKQKIMFLKTF